MKKIFALILFVICIKLNVLSQSTTFSFKTCDSTVGTLAQKITNSSNVNLFSIRNSGQIDVGIGSNLFIGNNSGLNNHCPTSNYYCASFNTAVGQEALKLNTTGYQNTAVGQEALMNNVVGYWNSAFGQGALLSNTSGYYNTAVGASCMLFNQTGYYNTAVGEVALGTLISGSFNTAMGQGSMTGMLTGSQNSSFGESSLYYNSAGNYNTSIGEASLFYNTGSNNIALGFRAGWRETGSNKIYIGSVSSTNEANGRRISAIYGYQGADSNTTFITINGQLKVSSGQTVVHNSTSGTTTFSQPFGGDTYKKIIIYLSSALGTASYTYPVAFTNMPMIMTSNQVSANIITSISTTGCTITGVSTTGFITIEGY